MDKEHVSRVLADEIKTLRKIKEGQEEAINFLAREKNDSSERLDLIVKLREQATLSVLMIERKKKELKEL